MNVEMEFDVVVIFQIVAVRLRKASYLCWENCFKQHNYVFLVLCDIGRVSLHYKTDGVGYTAIFNQLYLLYKARYTYCTTSSLNRTRPVQIFNYS